MNDEKQSGTGPEAYMNMWSNFLAITGQNRTMKPFVELTKLQQQQYLNMSKAWVDHLLNMGKAIRSGDAKTTLAKCAESNKDFLSVCQESLKIQAQARYELWRTFIPAVRKSAGVGV